MTIQYPYLPEGCTIQYVEANNPFMKAAQQVCFEHSTDDKQPTGAVVVMSGEIVGQGANQSSLRNPFLKAKHEDGWCIRKILKIKTGEKYWLCPGCSKFSDHGEAQAVANARKKREDLSGADMYLWGHWWCCKPCWDKNISVGIKNVFLLKGSEVFFNRSDPNNLLGRKNFDKFS